MKTAREVEHVREEQRDPDGKGEQHQPDVGRGALVLGRVALDGVVDLRIRRKPRVGGARTVEMAACG